MTNSIKPHYPKNGIKKSTTIDLLERTLTLFSNLLNKLNEDIFEPYINNEDDKFEKNITKLGKTSSLISVIKLMLSGLKTLIPLIKQFPLVDDGPSIAELDEEYSETYISAMRQIVADYDAKKAAEASLAKN